MNTGRGGLTLISTNRRSPRYLGEYDDVTGEENLTNR